MTGRHPKTNIQGKKFKYARNLHGGSIPVGITVTISDYDIGTLSSIDRNVNLYTVEYGNISYVRIDELEELIIDEKELQNLILATEQNILNQESRIEEFNDKINYMKENKLSILDEKDYKIHAIIKTLDDDKLDSATRRKLVRKLVYEQDL